jgi:hypothetical protein
MAYTKYSLTPADNNAAPPNGAPEGMLPSAVNDTMRDMMAQIRDVGDGIRGGTYTMTAPVITGGSITGVALSGNTLTNPVITGAAISTSTLTGNTFTSPVISGGSINNTPIGATTANTGKFTTLEATGVTTVQAGTAADPAITTTGDTNTGIFFPAADTIAFSEGGTEAARFDASGNLGIGTTSPANKLDVVGSTSTTKIRSLGTTGASYYFGENDGGNLSVGVDNSTGSAVCGTAYAQFVWGSGFLTPLIFGCNNTERMRITSAGDVLVGKTAGDTSNPGVWIYNQNSNQGRLNIIKTASGTLNSIANYHSGSYVGGVDYSNTATSFPTSSDIRLKKDIVDSPSAIDKVNDIRIVSHGWKNDDSHVEYGVVAQELEPIAPQAVKKGDDGETIEQTWGVDYSKLVPMLTKAIQELKATVDAQAARIAALESAGA